MWGGETGTGGTQRQNVDGGTCKQTYTHTHFALFALCVCSSFTEDHLGNVLDVVESILSVLSSSEPRTPDDIVEVASTLLLDLLKVCHNMNTSSPHFPRLVTALLQLLKLMSAHTYQVHAEKEQEKTCVCATTPAFHLTWACLCAPFLSLQAIVVQKSEPELLEFLTNAFSAFDRVVANVRSPRLWPVECGCVTHVILNIDCKYTHTHIHHVASRPLTVHWLLILPPSPFPPPHNNIDL